MKDVPLPPHYPISHDTVFPLKLKSRDTEIPDWNALKDHLLKEGRMYKADLV